MARFSCDILIVLSPLNILSGHRDSLKSKLAYSFFFSFFFVLSVITSVKNPWNITEKSWKS